MTSKEKKQKLEQHVFTAFATVCPLPIVLSSIESPDEPQPDILCRLETGDFLAFELGSVEDVLGMDKHGNAISAAKSDLDSKPHYVANYIVDGIQRKLDKRTYKTPHKIHLLAWSRTASRAELEIWKDKLTTLLQSKGLGLFTRIWVFGLGESSIVFDSAVDMQQVNH